MVLRLAARPAMTVSTHMATSYNNLIIVDFEATCDRKAPLKPQEIIEFPAIYLDATNSEVKSEFHRYVKPKFNPRLTTFCTELTGIIQSDVDDGISFEQALTDFNKWCESLSIQSFSIVTCGDWDLGTMLPSQCRAYDIPISQYFHQWINLKKIFAYHLGTWPRGMTHMLDVLGLPLVGRHHSGRDDCRNITKIVQALLKQGARFEITSFLQKPFDKAVPFT